MKLILLLTKSADLILPGMEEHAPAQSKYAKPPSAAVQRYHRDVAWGINTNAANNKMNPQEYLQAVDAHIPKVLGRFEVATRVPPDILHEILQDGRMKTQFETNTSNGALDPHFRAQWEQRHMGIPLKVNPYPHRPVYGYLKSLDHEDPAPHGIVNRYGSVQLTLKPHVKNRTTWTWGDSLGRAMVPSEVLHPRYHSFDLGDHTRWEEPLKLKKLTDTYPEYAEAQIHGGLHVRDIDHAVFHNLSYGGSGTPYPDLQEALSRAGIGWRMASDPEWMRKAMDNLNPADYEIIGRRGKGQFLLGQVGDDHEAEGAHARVLDVEQGVLFAPHPIQSVLKGGYWEPYAGDQSVLESLLRIIRHKE